MSEPRCWRARTRWLAAGCLLYSGTLASVACGAGGIRPNFGPFPEALSDTATVSADSAIVAAAGILESEGIELRHVRPWEGYLETRWINTTSGGRGSPESVANNEMVRIRFWADAVSEMRTLVVGEAVKPRVVDPSLPIREREMPLDEDHAGFAILRRVFDAVMQQLEGASGT